MNQIIAFSNILTMIKVKKRNQKVIIKTIILIIIAGGFEVFNLNAQNNENLNTSGFFRTSVIGRYYKTPPRGYGSPYLNDNWLKGDIVLISGDTLKNLLLKMDCYKNELVWMSDGKSMVSVDPNLVSSFTLFSKSDLTTERKFQKINFKLPLISDTVVKYLEVLNEGYFNLYSFRKIGIYSRPTAGTSGGLFTMNEYELESSYYIQAKNQPVKTIELKRKSLIKVYPDMAERMKKLLKDNHCGSIKNEIQLVNTLKLINTNW
jgi:hypothetical protein